MAKRRYVAKKVGDRYELTPAMPQDRMIDAAWAAGGGMLTLLGLWKRGLPGMLTMLAGGTMICRGVTGRNPLRRLLDWQCSQADDARQAPSYAHDFKGRATQLPRDEVEEASMESFPASDPPAQTVAPSSRR